MNLLFALVSACSDGEELRQVSQVTCSERESELSPGFCPEVQQMLRSCTSDNKTLYWNSGGRSIYISYSVKVAVAHYRSTST